MTRELQRFHATELPKNNIVIVNGEAKYDIKEFIAKIQSGSVIKVIYGDESFHGVLIQKRRKGIDSSIHIRQPNYHNTAVERMYKLYDPKLKEISVVRSADWARRARLYYLRDQPNKAKSGYK